MKHRGVENASENALQNHSKISSRRLQNGGPRGSKWAPGGLSGVERQSFEAETVFEAILEAILTPPGASKIDKKSLEMGPEIEAFFSDAF